MKKTIYLIEVMQPIGFFYIGKIEAKDLIKISIIKRRKFNEGVQRELSISRTTEIKKYCEDPDATFPTPIILSVNTEEVELERTEFSEEILKFCYTQDKIQAEIIDGQHRIEGIKRSNKFDYELPIVIMFDLTDEEKAYVFSTINSNQKSVDKSLIYDLFGLSSTRSPYKTCHEIARIMNSDKESPFYRKLKMLGRKSTEYESLSQGTFVTHLSKLITRNAEADMIDIKNGEELIDDSKLPFRKFFIEDDDEMILKILENYFSAVSKVFNEEWSKPNEFILSKTTGFGALLIALKDFFNEGYEKKDLTKDFFETKLERAKQNLINENKKLNSTDFPSNEAVQGKLAKILIQ